MKYFEQARVQNELSQIQMDILNTTAHNKRLQTILQASLAVKPVVAELILLIVSGT